MSVTDATPQVANGGPLVLDIPETAATLRCGRSTVYELLAAGELTGVKIGRRRLITYGSVAEFVTRQAEQGVA